MRFYDRDIVATRQNLAFVPLDAGPHGCFAAATSYLEAQFLLDWALRPDGRGRCRKLRPHGDDSLVHLARQVELSQRALSQLMQSDLRVVCARLVGANADEDLAAEAPR
jgi:hypothetical protein